MSGSEQVMAVMLEEDDLRMVHRDWPRKMRLAVCLMPSGDCQLLLFRQEEAGIFAARLRKHLGLRAAEVCIYPPVHGFPTRQLRYSDERSLAALLADSPQLVEEATDYSVNFAFALEEGLDPMAFLGMEADDTEVVVPPAPVVTADPAGTLQFSSRRGAVVANQSKPANRKLGLDLAREATRVSEITPVSVEALPVNAVADRTETELPGAAFKSVLELQDDMPAPGYELREDTTCFVISNGAGPLVEIESAGQLFLRDDRRLLAIRADRAGGQPGTVRIKTDILPRSLKSALRAGCGSVDVSRESGFLYVALPAEQPQVMAAKTPDVPEVPVQKPTKRRAAYRLLALTTLTALAILAVMGLEPLETLQQKAESGAIDWSQFRLSMQSEQ